MGISSEFLRRRVLSAIAALAQGEDSARTNLEGAGGSLLYSCSSFIMASWYHFMSVLKVILFCTKLKWIIVQVQRRGRPVHLWMMRKMAVRHLPLPRTPTPLLLLRLSSRLSASSAWSERSLFKLTFFHSICFKVFLSGQMCNVSPCFQCDIIFLPCGHLCSCSSCQQALATCPLCRANVLQRVRI